MKTYNVSWNEKAFESRKRRKETSGHKIADATKARDLGIKTLGMLDFLGNKLGYVVYLPVVDDLVRKQGIELLRQRRKKQKRTLFGLDKLASL